jgi:O-6-methylguanine DNA methyltransferase
MTETAALEGLLDTMRASAPATLADRVLATWVRVPARFGDVFIAITDQGIAKVAPAEVIDGDGEQFAAEYRAQFDRPIMAGTHVPPGIEEALRSGNATALSYDLRGLSKFEQAVLRKTLEIPSGEVRPYAWVAREIGRPGAVRATGTALGRNPVPVLIPCHRVTRSDGQPGNYAYGPALKERLLVAEEVDLDAMRALAGAGVHYIGDDTTHVVCYPTCHHARQTAPAHRRTFRSFAAALSLGYSACVDCRPALAESA